MLRHRLLLGLLACALFLRVLVPAGWMPAPGGAPFAIELCPAASAALVLHMAGDHHHGPAGHGSAHDADCAFGSLLAGATLADFDAAVGEPPTVRGASSPSIAAPVLKTGPPALPPPSTGPPALI